MTRARHNKSLKSNETYGFLSHLNNLAKTVSLRSDLQTADKLKLHEGANASIR